MEEKKSSLGETFINGRIVNLDKANIEDLERYINELDKQKESALLRFNKLAEEISNN